MSNEIDREFDLWWAEETDQGRARRQNYMHSHAFCAFEAGRARGAEAEREKIAASFDARAQVHHPATAARLELENEARMIRSRRSSPEAPQPGEKQRPFTEEQAHEIDIQVTSHFLAFERNRIAALDRRIGALEEKARPWRDGDPLVPTYDSSPSPSALREKVVEQELVASTRAMLRQEKGSADRLVTAIRALDSAEREGKHKTPRTAPHAAGDTEGSRPADLKWSGQPQNPAACEPGSSATPSATAHGGDATAEERDERESYVARLERAIEKGRLEGRKAGSGGWSRLDRRTYEAIIEEIEDAHQEGYDIGQEEEHAKIQSAERAAAARARQQALADAMAACTITEGHAMASPHPVPCKVCLQRTRDEDQIRALLEAEIEGAAA